MARRSSALSLENKHYDPASVEEPTYRLWEERDIFTANPGSSRPPYSIVIPPPNVTGRLHMGHALNNSVQDALIRFKRMDGYDVCWIPGTDHAGISTQSVVKKHLDAEGINYLELGREKMVERIWQWKQKYGDQILMQLRRMGCSCDWSRTRFTMDDACSRAVRTAFKRLYDEGLIYKGKYIVNWCPVDRTALSDDEVITTEGGEPGHLWYFRYPLTDGSGSVVIATTRPETMLGDTAIAVNPKDDRYQHLIGKTVRLPLVGRDIPIIADDYVDKEFGTGCLKVTPAHDPYDFQIGQRHNLPQVNVMNEDATMSDDAPVAYRGLDRFVARDRVVADLTALGLVERVEDRMTPIGRAQRSRAIIEYRLSDQWFVKMRPLADAALRLSEEGSITLHPERWENVYRGWLVNTRDWCISRQIWWGHRIPAWYNRKTGAIAVDVETPAEVAANPDEWFQDEDVLDTWFSSALWPYSTLGWPDRTEDLDRYYPTSVLSTAKDIIYFWVARMVMTGVQFMKETPFRQVYFHPVVCDAQGETMSKSKGNGIDPLHVIEGASMKQLEEPIFEARPENMNELLTRLRSSYPEGFKGVGADALRLTLLSLNSYAQQIQISFQKFEETGRRFTEKLWNAGRFVISNISSATAGVVPGPLEKEDRWILGRLDTTIAEVRQSLDQFLFHEAVATLSRFFWDDFCDWYLELTKPRLREGSAADKRRVQETLAEGLAAVLRLLHPMTPFITEELWGHLHPLLVQGEIASTADLREADLCAQAPYPKGKGRSDALLDEEFVVLQDVVRAIRAMRAHAGIEGAVELTAYARPVDERTKSLLAAGSDIIRRSAKLASLAFVSEKPAKTAVAVLDRVELFVDLAAHMDIGAEIERNRAQLKKVEAEIAKLGSRLSNPGFMERAPAQVREAEQKNMADAEERKAKILATIADLEEMRS